MMRTLFRTFILLTLLSTVACGQDTATVDNQDSTPQVSSPSLSQNPNSSFQIVREGQSLPLQNLLGLQIGQEVSLSVLGANQPIEWLTFDPYAGIFVSPGRLRLTGAGRFYIGAVSGAQGDYVIVEVLETSSAVPIPSTPEEPACVPTTCAQQGKNCGQISDACGAFIDCGVCSRTGEMCGGSSPNVCSVPPAMMPSRPVSLPSDPFIDEIISFTPGIGASADLSENRARVLGAPQGCGIACGSFDVLSLGQGGEIVLRSATPILNEAGVDFIIFENPFYAGGNPMGLLFAELGEVSVSQNGRDFVSYPCQTLNRTDFYPGCAGAHPVYANSETNTISPIDLTVSGGDGFDLQTLGLDWVQYIRIQDLRTIGGSGFDLDAIAIVHQ